MYRYKMTAKTLSLSPMRRALGQGISFSRIAGLLLLFYYNQRCTHTHINIIHNNITTIIRDMCHRQCGAKTRRVFEYLRCTYLAYNIIM